MSESNACSYGTGTYAGRTPVSHEDFHGDLKRDAYHGGNSDNDAQCGPWYLNLNNVASHVNWNIGTAQSYLKVKMTKMPFISPSSR